jgi:hypothetical protein
MWLKKNIKKILFILELHILRIKNFSIISFVRQKVFNESLINVSIVSSKETLKTIQFQIENELVGAYLRFGDGDVLLMIGCNDSHQRYSKELSNEMHEAFQLNGSGVFKCLAVHSERYGYDEGMGFGNHKNQDDFANLLLSKTFQYFIGERIYSPVALHFAATNHVESAKIFLKVLHNAASLFVGNSSISDETIYKVFGHVKRIDTPSRDAYNELDSIEAQCLLEINQMVSFQVIIVAMGCSGRILTKRLISNNKNCFYFDFGSLIDGFEGNTSRKWLAMNTICYDYLIN